MFKNLIKSSFVLAAMVSQGGFAKPSNTAPQAVEKVSASQAVKNTSLPAKLKQYKIDSAHSSVQFKVAHLVISSVKGNFLDFSGNIEMDPDLIKTDVSAFKANVEIKVASISTGNTDRDKHLQSPDFFDVTKFPTLTFVSTSFVPVGTSGKTFNLAGNFTMHGVTNKVTFQVDYNGSVMADKQKRVVFSASTKVDRRQFGLVWSKLVEAGPAVGDEVTIELSVEAIEQAV